MSYPAFEGRFAPYGPIAPAGNIYELTPDDGNDLPTPVRTFYATADGDVAVVTVKGDTVTVPVVAYKDISVGVVRVLATGTTVVGRIMGYSE